MKIRTKLMITLIQLAVVSGLASGCATSRTKKSDPVLRVAVDARDMSAGSYMRLEKALFADGRFQVIDRGKGFEAAVSEQDMVHKEMSNRFNDRDKYALWKRLYGIGGVIIANQDCQEHLTWRNYRYFVCHEELSLINATTGEVMSIADGDAETEDNVPTPGWAGVVASLGDAFPAKFVNTDDVHQTIKYDETLEKYRDQAEKAAQDSSAGRVPASTERGRHE